MFLGEKQREFTLHCQINGIQSGLSTEASAICSSTVPTHTRKQTNGTVDSQATHKKPTVRNWRFEKKRDFWVRGLCSSNLQKNFIFLSFVFGRDIQLDQMTAQHILPSRKLSSKCYTAVGVGYIFYNSLSLLIFVFF